MAESCIQDLRWSRLDKLPKCKVYLDEKLSDNWVEIRFKTPMLKSLFLTKEECRLASARGEALWRLMELFADGRKPSLEELSKVGRELGERALKDGLQILEEVLEDG